ncbi:MAG: hypothetical protein GTN62_06790 [Gemmatimonadales bacterium]|nr:hypothetical protein [Gemmatimonadales bacterium]NIN11205.1 hypothetical protein [Gemmatimonadales bacterium]NIN49804.1 hypothetical protein [Gemmatimonadales bacterium]NIP07268.1 hypothetical protein [Gemmatimonadales bacterium]NIR02963.1 hypothetical protein [Gemmatimonadales bacterium]
MRLRDFQSMIERLAAEIPPRFFDGIAGVEVSPKTIPHPVRAGVYTLGECIPIDTGTDEVASRVVLYHGSFLELAGERSDFDWREEAWETLLHELRHHLEWRAASQKLEDYDWAAEQNFARAEGGGFDPLFYRSGERVERGIYRVEDDIFIERVVGRLPATTDVAWHGRRYRVSVPYALLPLYLALDGLSHPPSGDVFLVFRRRPRLWDLLRPAARATGQRAKVESLE